jgi:hypothetical protein
MTGRVSDAEKDGFVFGLRASQRLVAPGVPIDWIVSVLQQIGARFCNLDIAPQL